MSINERDPYFGNGFKPVRLMMSESTIYKIRMPSIVGKYGVMPDRFQKLFDESIGEKTEIGLHRAFMILDRWRFANLERDEQIRELAIHRENFEDRLREGFRLSAHPDDTADLVIPENVILSDWLNNISPIPSEGFKSLPER